MKDDKVVSYAKMSLWAILVSGLLLHKHNKADICKRLIELEFVKNLGDSSHGTSLIAYSNDW